MQQLQQQHQRPSLQLRRQRPLLHWLMAKPFVLMSPLFVISIHLLLGLKRARRTDHRHLLQVELGVEVEQLISLEEEAGEVRLDLVVEVVVLVEELIVEMVDLEVGEVVVPVELSDLAVAEEEGVVVPRALLTFLLVAEVVVEGRMVRMKLVLVELREAVERVYDDL